MPKHKKKHKHNKQKTASTSRKKWSRILTGKNCLLLVTTIGLCFATIKNYRLRASNKQLLQTIDHLHLRGDRGDHKHTSNRILPTLPNALLTPPTSKYLEQSRTILIESFCGRFSKEKKFPPSMCEEVLVTELQETKVCTDRSVATQLCFENPLGQVTKYSRKQRSKALKLCKATGYSPCKPYSQQNEDMALFNMFFRDSTGSGYTYVEMGAFDGTSYSNTKFFEQTLGWNGVLVEASRPSFVKLERARSREANAIYNTAVCNKKRIVQFTGTHAIAGMAKSFPQQIKSLNTGHRSYSIGCEKLSTILENANVKKIDMWSLDVEGAELEVLEGMNWKIPVHVLIIERNPGLRAIERLLLKKGFTYLREQRGNRIWVDEKYKEKVKRLGLNWKSSTIKTGSRGVWKRSGWFSR